MQRFARFARRGIGLAMLGVLGFGAREALAATGVQLADHCTPCSSQSECEACCIDEDFAGGTCFVASGACFCFH